MFKILSIVLVCVLSFGLLVACVPDPEIESISLDKEKATLVIGDTITLTATAHMTDETTSKDVMFDWSSSNDEVATVDEGGVVTAIAVGEADIKVENGDKPAVCKVTVVEKTTVTAEEWTEALKLNNFYNVKLEYIKYTGDILEDARDYRRYNIDFDYSSETAGKVYCKSIDNKEDAVNSFYEYGDNIYEYTKTSVAWEKNPINLDAAIGLMDLKEALNTVVEVGYDKFDRDITTNGYVFEDTENNSVIKVNFVANKLTYLSVTNNDVDFEVKFSDYGETKVVLPSFATVTEDEWLAALSIEKLYNVTVKWTTINADPTLTTVKNIELDYTDDKNGKEHKLDAGVEYFYKVETTIADSVETTNKYQYTKNAETNAWEYAPAPTDLFGQPTFDLVKQFFVTSLQGKFASFTYNEETASYTGDGIGATEIKFVDGEMVSCNFTALKMLFEFSKYGETKVTLPPATAKPVV